LEHILTKVLVIDDDRLVRHIVVSALSVHQHLTVIQAADGDEGLRSIERDNPSVILLDVFLPEHNGLELFRKIKALDGKVPVIFITADTSSETAIQAMSSGAFDYLAKPLNVEQVRKLTLSAARARKAMDEPVAFSIGEGVADGERFIGRSKAMIEVYKSIGRVAPQNVTVLIRGESGCGKELVARAVFQNSDRRSKPFVAVNCAAIPDQLLESELFGHEKGAFTGAEKRRIGRFEQCDSGTIFLDEIGDMSFVTQGKVLRLLQEQKFERVGGGELIQTDVRIIAATNRPLEQMVDEGTFREDLLYRLNGFTICLPPLRERAEDIPLLLEYYFRRAKFDMSRPDLSGMSPEAFALMQQYEWPGNVRQLQSVVRQSVLNTIGPVIGRDNLPDFIRDEKSSSSVPTDCMEESAELSPPKADPKREATDDDAITDDPLPDDRQAAAVSLATGPSDEVTADHPDFDVNLSRFIEAQIAKNTTNLYADALERMERQLFAEVLQATNGNQSKAAELLGITRGKVRDRVSSFGIQFEKTVSVPKTE
jgi:DNA-binding NtrC family response regulator